MTEFDLQLGDCLTGMKKLPPESVDIVVTSPPYNLGITYSKYDDTVDRGAYLDWSREWISEVARLLKPDGSLFLNVGAAPANPFLPHEIALTARDILTLQNTVHWIKSISVETRDGQQISAGHFKPINSKRFINDCHEYVFHFTRSGNVAIDRRGAGVPYQDKSNIKRWGHTGGEDLRCRGNTWFIPYKTINSRDKDRPHPATFPPALAIQCLKLQGKGAGTVMLEPFLGIGSAASAARDYGVAKFYGFEIDEHYFSVAHETVSRDGQLI